MKPKQLPTKGLAKSRIERVFAKAQHQADAVIGLYRLVYPEWDTIKTVDGWPSVSRATGRFIMGLAMAFDKKHHPDVVPGGAWLNNGFSVLDETVPDWRVRPAPVTYR